MAQRIPGGTLFNSDCSCRKNFHDFRYEKDSSTSKDENGCLPAVDNTESLESQVDRLARYIVENVPGEPSESEGAIDCVIRIIARQADQVSRLTEAIQSEANDMLATGNDRAEHTAARRRLLLSVLTQPAARQGEKEKA
jgi:hypothetical protein